MWRRKCIASTRYAGVTSTEAIRCRPPTYRPLFPSVYSLSSPVSSLSSSTYSTSSKTHSRHRSSGISSFRPLKLGLPISRVRYCSAGAHAMAAKDREILPDVYVIECTAMVAFLCRRFQIDQLPGPNPVTITSLCMICSLVVRGVTTAPLKLMRGSPVRPKTLSLIRRILKSRM